MLNGNSNGCRLQTSWGHRNGAEAILDILIHLPTPLFSSYCKFNGRYNRVLGKISRMPTTGGVETDSLSLSFYCHTIIRDSLCDYQWRCPHSGPSRCASWETWHSTRRALQGGTLVSAVVKSRLSHLLTQLRLQLLQGVSAVSPGSCPPLLGTIILHDFYDDGREQWPESRFTDAIYYELLKG